MLHMPNTSLNLILYIKNIKLTFIILVNETAPEFGSLITECDPNSITNEKLLIDMVRENNP